VGGPELTPTERLRVGFFSDATAWGGAEICLSNLLSSLGDHIDVTLIGVCPITLARLEVARPTARIVLAPDVPARSGLRAKVALRRLISELDLEILQANLNRQSSCSSALMAAVSLPGLRVIAVEHSPVPAQTKAGVRYKRVISPLLDAHVAVGYATARSIEEAADLRRGSVRAIPNGVVDVGAPKRRHSRAGPIVIGTLARLHPYKGLDVLLAALPSLPEAEVMLVGDGPERTKLAWQAEQLGVADRVRFIEWTDSPRSLLGELTVFVLPSRVEAMPLSIIEAMLAGLPVVASDVGSVAETVVHGVTGLLVPPDDPEALALAVREMIHDPTRASEMGARGRRRALDRFTASRMASSYEALYNEILGRSQPGTITTTARDSSEDAPPLAI
jgi:glycosyltransferase involved in cell wall biosynthesis